MDRTSAVGVIAVVGFCGSLAACSDTTNCARLSEGGVLVPKPRASSSRHRGSRTRLVVTGARRHPRASHDYERWATPSRETSTYPLPNEPLVAITHTFRHIFWRQVTTTVHRCPAMRIADLVVA